MAGFAFGASALVTTEGLSLVLRAADGDHDELRRVELAARPVALAIAGDEVVALDAGGAATVIEIASGDVKRVLEAGDGAALLAAAPDGAFAVAGPQGVVVVTSGDPLSMDLRGGTALAIGGHLLAIGGKDGTVRVLDVRRSSALGACRVGGVVHGLARSPRGDWIASTDAAIVRVEREAGEAFAIVDTQELEVGPLACDASGALVAVRVGEHKVAIFDLLEGKLRGTLGYDAAVVGMAFSGSRLGVGLARGGFHVVDLDQTEHEPREGVELRLKTADIAALVARARAGEAPSAALRKPAVGTAPTPTRTAILWMIAFTLVVVALLVLLRP